MALVLHQRRPSETALPGSRRRDRAASSEARFELRLPDGSTNPYLLQAGVIAAGLDGIANGRSPGRRLDNNMYTDPLAPDSIRRLPNSLFDALRALKENKELTLALGAPFVEAFIKLKEQEWAEHHAHVSSWERQMTLDC